MKYRKTSSKPYITSIDYRQTVFIEFREPATALTPIENRKYTMTHSDETGDLFVVIDTEYAEDKVGPLQDEIRLEWTMMKGMPILYGMVLVDGNGIDVDNAATRDMIFKREMHVALQAIYFADQLLLDAYPELRDTPILIHFSSTQPEYNKVYHFGTIGEYSSF